VIRAVRSWEKEEGKKVKKRGMKVMKMRVVVLIIFVFGWWCLILCVS
jgi:hypothetical protein